MLKGKKLRTPLLLLEKSEVGDCKVKKVSRHLGQLPSQDEINVYVLL